MFYRTRHYFKSIGKFTPEIRCSLVDFDSCLEPMSPLPLQEEITTNRVDLRPFSTNSFPEFGNIL